MSGMTARAVFWNPRTRPSYDRSTRREGFIRNMNFRYPIFLDVEGKRCLVTGAGSEIAAKIRTLVSRGARVTYVNPAAGGCDCGVSRRTTNRVARAAI